MISQAKITALREALERDGTVTFKNGSIIERGEILGQDAFGRMEHRPHFVVIRPIGGVSRFADSNPEIRRAYEMALNGPRAKRQPPAKDFGEVPW